MIELSVIVFVKALINTIIRLTPIGLYSGSAMSSILFDDNRGTLLFIGFMINEFISLGYRMSFNSVYNPQCALLRTPDNNFVLPSPISQTVGFFAAFLMMEMYYTGEFKPLKFFILISLVGITIWSRNNIGCKSVVDALFSTAIGMFIGVAYYSIIKDYYKQNVYGKLDDSDDHIENAKNIFFELF